MKCVTPNCECNCRLIVLSYLCESFYIYCARAYQANKTLASRESSSAGGNLIWKRHDMLSINQTNLESQPIIVDNSWQQLREEQGATLVYFALVLMLLFGFAGIALDGSNAYYQRLRMQTAADAAALAGTRMLALEGDISAVDSEIDTIASLNGAGTINWTYINDGRGAHVSTSRTFDTYFAGLFGYHELTVTAVAAAVYHPVSTASPKLFPLTTKCDCVEQGETRLSAGYLPADELTVEAVQPVTITIADDQNTTLEVSLVDHSEDTWTYRVTETNGRDLSHWNIGVDSCLSSYVESVWPPTSALGIDGITGFYGIKWDVDDAFTSAEFSFTVSGNYTIGTVEVLVKAGPQFAKAETLGPVCYRGGGSGAGDCSFSWLDWDGSASSDNELVSNIQNLDAGGVLSIGDWIPLGPDIEDTLQIRQALDNWSGQSVTIPLYDEYDEDRGYLICGFAEFRVLEFEFWDSERWLRGEFLPAVVRSHTTDENVSDYGVRDILFVQ